MPTHLEKAMAETRVDLAALKAAREECKPRKWIGHCHIEGDAEAKRQHSANQKFLNVALGSIDQLISDAEQVESLRTTEFEIRKTLWLGHGHAGLYGDDGEMQCNLAGCLLDFKRAPLEKLISRVLELLGSLRAERDELNASFDLRWKADMRAIARWREAHPGNELVMPDHADLCVWLLAEVDALQADGERLDWLESEGDPRLVWVARESTTGRGYRLHQSLGRDGHATARLAIDHARKSCK